MISNITADLCELIQISCWSGLRRFDTVAVGVYLALNWAFPPYESFVDVPVHDIKPETVTAYQGYGQASGPDDLEKVGGWSSGARKEV